jgi:hypothetical protein
MGRHALLVAEELVVDHLPEATGLERLRGLEVHELPALVVGRVLDAFAPRPARSGSERFQGCENNASRQRERDDRGSQSEQYGASAGHAVPYPRTR